MNNDSSHPRNRVLVLAGSLAALAVLGGLAAWLLLGRGGDPADVAGKPG